MDLELDLEKLPAQDPTQEPDDDDSLDDAEGAPSEELGSDDVDVTPVSRFVPFDAPSLCLREPPLSTASSPSTDPRGRQEPPLRRRSAQCA